MSTIHSKITNSKSAQRAAQLALSTIPKFHNIRVDLDPSGNLLYVDVATGHSDADPSVIFNERETLGLVDYRLFDPGVGGNALRNIGTSSGTLQLDSEVMIANQFLRDASTDPIKAQRLRNLGLGHMIGEEVTGELHKFDTRGQRGVIRQIQLLGVDKGAAASSQTDEGFTFLTLKGKRQTLTSMQASRLRIISGAEQIKPEFLAQLAEVSADGSQNWSKIGKLAKRLQSTMSPRNVAVGEEFIQQHLDIIKPDGTKILFQDRTLSIDSIAARFELMFRDPGKGIPIRESDGLTLTPLEISENIDDQIVGYEQIPDYQLTDSERQLMYAGPGEGDIVQRRRKDELPRDLWDRRLTNRRNKELDSLRRNYHFEDSDIKSVQGMFDEAVGDLADPLHELNKPEFAGMTVAEKQFKLIKEKIKALEAVDPDLAAKINVAINGMEKARDGQYYITPDLLKNMKSGFQKQLDVRGSQLKTRGTVMSLAETNEIKALEQQIKHIGEAQEKIDSGDVIARLNGFEGQFKGEAMVIGHAQAERFRDKTTGLIPYVIGDITAIKDEVGSAIARNFLMDVGDTSTRTFTDPLMMLYHSEYFTQPAMIASIKENASYGLGKMEEFMKTGNAPGEVIKALKMDIAGDIRTIEAVMLDPQTRMSHLRKKREAEEIMAQMASGIRVNEIPAMVRRVADHYSSQVVRYKDGRTDAVMPTAGRFSLRTFESRLVNAEDFESYSGYDINLADYGVSSPGVTKGIRTAGFRIKDKTLMMSGDAAYLYQHALGGFDLDDKGIPLMSTFKDSSGKKRLAFLTLRQPTSFQEYIAMSADLSDSSTVNALFKENDKFKAALKDDTVLSALGINKKDKTYEQLNSMVNGGDSVKRNEVDKDKIEQMMLRILESEHVYPKGLPSLTDSQVVRMAMTQSPAALGLDRLVQDKSGNLSPLGKFMQGIGLDPSKNPAPYDSDSVFQIFQKAAEKDNNTQLFRRATQELGYTVADSDHIKQILQGAGPGYQDEDNIKLFALMKKMTEEIMAESANTDAANSIGTFVNRQGAGVAVLEQAKTILTEELGIKSSDPLYEKFLEMTSVMTLPASEGVDIAKQVGAYRVMDNFGPALQMVQETQGIKESTAETVLRAYIESLRDPQFSPLADGMTLAELTDPSVFQIPMKLDPMGQSSLRAFSGVGYIRGKQMADQIAASGSIDKDKLFGLQETMFKGGFARIKENSSDRSIVKAELVRGLQAAADEVGPGAAQDAINTRIEEMNSQADPGLALTDFFMERGTSAYEDYAHVDQMVHALTDIQGASEAIKTKSIASARAVTRNTPTTSHARYQDTAQNILSSVSSDIQTIQEKAQLLLQGENDQGAFGLKKLRNETVTKIHANMSAAIEAERIAGRPTGTSDILDLMETLTASLESRGGHAQKLLTSSVVTGEDGDPGISTMLEMFDAVRRRNIAKGSIARADIRSVLAADDAYGSVDELRSTAAKIIADKPSSGIPMLARMPVPISTELADMTTEEAEAIIDAGRKIRRSRKADLTPAEQIIGDFAGRVKALAEGKVLGDRPGEAPEAVDAFMYHVAGRRVLEEADQRASEAVTGFLRGADIPAAAKDAVATSVTSARTAFSDGTTYKRVVESFKTGALGDALKNKGVRTGLAAAAALSVVGFVKSYRRDHSSDDISGPPLLPGGSAYESGYPARQAVIENLRTLNPLTRGMQYKVYTSGSSEDAEKLRSMVGGVTDGEVNSTMYSSLPLLGQDPYSQVASQF